MTRAIPLSPIDHVFTGAAAYPLEFVFAYGGTIDPDRLRASLQRVLESFPPFSSRLACQDERYVLVPTRDHKGRVPAVEVMLASPAVRKSSVALGQAVLGLVVILVKSASAGL